MQGRPNAIVDKKSGRILVQTPLPRFNCLALEGGGVACAGHAGAINMLEKYGLLDDVDYVSGISGGAIAALGICLGYTGEEITKILSNLPTDKFMEGSDSWSFTPSAVGSLRKAISIWRSPNYSLSSGKIFIAWLQQMVKDKLGDEDATLLDLDKKIEEEKAKNNGKSRFKKLYIGATDLSLEIPETKVFSAETQPPISLAMVTFMSACYPFLFKPVEWQGHLWGDGGIKSILLTKVFDDKKFLPEGYGFTEKAVNPGVLAVKVDTYDEIMQIIWGVHKEVKITKTSTYALQVANAALHNTDVAEIREARMTIPLADADVDRLDLNLTPKMKLRLVEEAESSTKEFFENHIDAAYQVTSYKDMKEWLGAQSIEYLSAIRNTYKVMLSELLADPLEVEARDVKDKFDPSKPSVAQLNIQINFLKEYIQCCLKKRKRTEGEISYPAFHINISPEFSANSWHASIKREMQNRLEILNAKIDSAQSEYENLSSDLVDCMQALTQYAQGGQSAEPFHGYNDEKVQVLASYHEYLNNLRVERDGIECKLGIEADHHIESDVKSSREYALLYEKLIALSKAIDLSATLRAVMITSLPIYIFDANKDCGLDFKLDMRKFCDRKLYLIAAMMYLEKRCCYDKNRFSEIFQLFFPGEKKLPTNAADLMMMIGQENPELQVSMFRLENLLHHFEKTEYPTYKPAMDLDVMFGLSKVSFFAKPKKNAEKENEIEMQMVFKTPDKNVRGSIVSFIPQERNSDGEDSSDENLAPLRH